MFKRALVIGASRGLGKAISQLLPLECDQLSLLTLVSRKSSLVTHSGISIESYNLDMSNVEDQIAVSMNIKDKKYDLLFYVAGGGPHGEYAKKEWKNHQWSLQVNLVAPMGAVHTWLNSREKSSKGKFILIGSHIAERAPDPLASSYAAGKHGLFGFVSSLQSELNGNSNKVWLASPTYLNTDLLPTSAKVRHDGTKILEVDSVAQRILSWVFDENGTWHQVLD